jgi:NAD(P)-dependent dehydrogenase (short-subunit alcohol dehydrogenase family)
VEHARLEARLGKGMRILRLAIDTHTITSKYLLPLLISQPGGLVIEVTDGTTKYNPSHYRISVYYDLAKVAVNRLAFSQGHELAPYEVRRWLSRPVGFGQR